MRIIGYLSWMTRTWNCWEVSTRRRALRGLLVLIFFVFNVMADMWGFRFVTPPWPINFGFPDWKQGGGKVFEAI